VLRRPPAPEAADGGRADAGPDPDGRTPGTPGSVRRAHPRTTTLAATRAFFLASPAMAWLMLFFLLPLLFVGVASFMTRGPGGQPVAPWTFEHYERTFSVFGPVIWRTLGFAAMTTVVSLLLGYPTAMFIASRRRAGVRLALLFLVLLPFWTNFLVRTYALITIVQREGLLNATLVRWGILQEGVQLLFTPAAVVMGLVYGYLPFMVLPIYAAVDRLDRRFVEAAHDLGANDWRAFWRVIWPLTLPGVVAGSMLVFIPAIGAFVTPDLMGGTGGLMIGNLVQSQFRGRGNVPLGSAMSMVLLVIVFVGVIVYGRWGERREP
jgi:spermidine/putrescine transport system permease protein